MNTGVFVVNTWVFTVFWSILCCDRGDFRGRLGEWTCFRVLLVSPPSPPWRSPLSSFGVTEEIFEYIEQV